MKMIIISLGSLFTAAAKDFFKGSITIFLSRHNGPCELQTWKTCTNNPKVCLSHRERWSCLAWWGMQICFEFFTQFVCIVCCLVHYTTCVPAFVTSFFLFFLTILFSIVQYAGTKLPWESLYLPSSGSSSALAEANSVVRPPPKQSSLYFTIHFVNIHWQAEHFNIMLSHHLLLMVMLLLHHYFLRY